MIADNTPVLVGAGQFTERLDDAGYKGLSAVDIAAEAARAALTDSGSDELANRIDLIATTRTFEDSAPHLAFPFGRSNNFPRSICARLAIDPHHAIWEQAGGNTPQQLVSEACERIASGEFSAALVCGAEAISTARHFIRNKQSVDWSEQVDGQVEDRGLNADPMASAMELGHGLVSAPLFYGVIENARRARLGMDRSSYALEMGRLFAPLTRIAAANPYSAAPGREFDATELATVTSENRMIADPYPRLLVSRDQVNQGAAVIVTSVGLARSLGIPESAWVYLHGHAYASEQNLLEREDIGAAPSAIQVARAALEMAAIDTDAIDFFDHYSCFPVAVSNVLDGLGIALDDPRPMSLTGGLCYFGGPGNNYSMHAIAEVVAAARAAPGKRGYVGANGGFLSKYAAGIYSTEPRAFAAFDKRNLQNGSEPADAIEIDSAPSGTARIETYTLSFDRDNSPTQAVAIGRLDDSGKRFIAVNAKDDQETPALMASDDPLGRQIVVQSIGGKNTFRLC